MSHIRGTAEIYREKKQQKFLYPEGVSPLEQSIKCLLGEDGNFCHFHVKTKEKY